MEWWQRLQIEIDRLGWDMAELSRRSGVNYDSINKYLHGGVAQPRGDAMKQIATAIGKTEIWLRTGFELIDAKPASSRRRGEKRLDAAETPVTLELDAKAGAGGGGMFTGEQWTEGGITVTKETAAAEWVIPPAFMRGQLRVSPGNALIIEVYGDSGYDPANSGAPGSVFPGDRVIVDMADKRPSPPGPFAVHDGVGVVIKLVEVLPRTDPVLLRLSSRNPTYKPYEVTEEEARIIGRVRGRISAM